MATTSVNSHEDEDRVLFWGREVSGGSGPGRSRLGGSAVNVEKTSLCSEVNLESVVSWDPGKAHMLLGSAVQVWGRVAAPV